MPSVPVRGAARRRDVPRGRLARREQSSGRCFSRVFPSPRRNPDRSAGPLRPRGRDPAHDPDRARCAWCSVRRRASLEVGARALFGAPRVRRGDRSVARAPARTGAHGRGRRAAPGRSKTSGDARAAVVDEPRPQDRSLIDHAVANGSLGLGAIHDSSAPHGGARGRERGHLGTTKQAIPNSHSPGRAPGERRADGPGHQGGERRHPPRRSGLRRQCQSALCGGARTIRDHERIPRRDGRRQSSWRREHSNLGRRDDRRRRPRPGRRRDHRRRTGPSLDCREAAVGQYPRRDPQRGEDPRRARAGPHRREGGSDDLPPRDLHRAGADEPRSRRDHRVCAGWW